MAATLDVFGAWRDALQKWEKETNAALNLATGDERVTRAMNQSLGVIAQLKSKQSEAMEKGLAQVNLPSKADFRAVNSRLDGIERQLAKLSDMVKALAKAQGVAVVASSIPRPARTRKPPPASGKPAKDGPK